jgi:hypothetical protein
MKMSDLPPGSTKKGGLYQLRTGVPVEEGDVVRVGGPFDTFGVVTKLNDDGYHLIHGIGKSKELSKALLGRHVPYCIGENN